MRICNWHTVLVYAAPEDSCNWRTNSNVNRNVKGVKNDKAVKIIYINTTRKKVD